MELQFKPPNYIWCFHFLLCSGFYPIVKFNTSPIEKHFYPYYLYAYMHRKYLHIISWILLLTFFVSNTGFAIYTHVCHTSNSQSVSIFGPEYCALDAPQEDDCCAMLETEKQSTDDCCDEETTFAKLNANAKPETTSSLLHSFRLLDLGLPLLHLNNWQPTAFTAELLCIAHPPEPDILQPLTAQERLTALATFLC